MHDDMTERLLPIVAKYTTATEIGPDSRFQQDLGIDSFDMVNIVIEAREQFGFVFPEKRPPVFATVGDMIGYMRKLR